MTNDRVACCACDETPEQVARRFDALRPYGPDGAPICHSCAHSTPALREEAARRQLGAAIGEAVQMLMQADAGLASVH